MNPERKPNHLRLFTKTKSKTNNPKTIKITLKPMICGIADELFGEGLELVEVGIEVGVGDGADKEVGDGVFVASVIDGVGVGVSVGVGVEVGEIEELGVISVVGFGVAVGWAISRFNV
jgi:hypothetical protein